MCFKLLQVVALDNRAQFLGADAIACCLDVRRDCVLSLGGKTCGIVFTVRLISRRRWKIDAD
jgi:hypothetical protein